MGERGRGLTENARRADSLRPAPADRARRARRRASARPLVVRALPAGAGPRSERAARARRRTGRTPVASAPHAGAGGARVEWHSVARAEAENQVTTSKQRSFCDLLPKSHRTTPEAAVLFASR